MSIILFTVSVAVVIVLQRMARRANAGRTAGSRRRGALLRRRPLTAAATAVNAAPTFETARRWTTRAYVTVLAIFLIAPMLVIIKNGLDTAQVSGPGMEGFTLKWVGQAFSADGYRTQLLFSLRLAVIAVTCGLILSAAASWAIVRFRFPGRDGVVAFLMSPLLMPQAALAVGYVLFFLILHTEPSFQRLLLAHVVVTIPFMTRVLLSTFEGVDARMEEAAAALGARPLTVFRRITLPVVRSGIFTAVLFGFLVSFDESAISVLVASGSTTTLPVKLLSDMQFQATPVGAAVAAVLIVAITALVIPLERRLGIASSAVAIPRRTGASADRGGSR
jgi:ABC-type spermidine/putrescine transport system permease subunit II